jgi:hypothetical protein
LCWNLAVNSTIARNIDEVKVVTMFSKKYEYRADNPGVRENIERIRQRMIANLAPAQFQSGISDNRSAGHEITGRGDPAAIALEWQDYDGPDQNLSAAATSCHQIAEDHLQADLRQGVLSSLSKAVRRSLQWYTRPSERFWESVTTGLNHVITSLKAHDAVLQIHADAVSGSQRRYSELVGQLQGVQAGKPGRFASQSEGDTGQAH